MMTNSRVALSTSQTDRAAGVLVGQAVGDALGVPYELARPPAEDELAEMRGGGLGDYAPGEWSDDTQMAACIASVLADGHRPRPVEAADAKALDAVAQGFLAWFGTDPADIGVQTSSVLSRLAALDPGDQDATRLTEIADAYAAANPQSAGNGALMRTSVIGLCALDDRETTAEVARAVAGLTHADPLALDSAVLWSEAVRVAVLDARFDLAPGLDLVPSERRSQWATWIDDATGADARRFHPNGFTVTALQAAWAAITSTPVPALDPLAGSFPGQHLQHALHAAVRVGDDTDTVAAIAGGLLGARWGSSAVPASWRDLVHGWPGLRATDLVALAVRTARGGADEPSPRAGGTIWDAVDELGSAR